MKRLLFVIILAATGWGGYWFIGSAGVTRGVEAWFAARHAEGWVAEVGSVSTRGFPSRFDTTLTNVSLADPETGIAYTLPFLQIFALSYKPQHLIAVWPNEQVLASPYGTANITTDDMRASLVVTERSSLTLQRTNLAIEELSVVLEDNRRFGAERALAAIEHIPDMPQHSYHFGVETGGLFLPLPQSAYVQSSGLLPETFSRARADVTVQFDAPWDINAVQARRPQPVKIMVKLIEARWGQLEFKIAGALNVNTSGVPEGQLTIKATNWRDILALGVSSGLVPKQLDRPIEQALDLLSGLSGNVESLDLPVNFENGSFSIGPIPLGTAPKLRLR